MRDRTACVHTYRNDPIRGGTLVKKEKGVRIAGVRAEWEEGRGSNAQWRGWGGGVRS